MLRHRLRRQQPHAARPDAQRLHLPGGPQPQPYYAVHHATLYASKDPVALDAVALKRLEEWRVRANLRAIQPMAAYIDFASQIGLGNSAPNRIELKNIGR